MSRNDYDVIVIGGGHAGAEAAWAAARVGATVALITLDPARIGQMSCNPAIGGLAKGQMVREIDALGGLMGVAIDNTGIQFRMLNRSKGPAVWGPRAQADKYKYALEVQRLLATCPNLDIVTGEVADIVVEGSGLRVEEGSGFRVQGSGEDTAAGAGDLQGAIGFGVQGSDGSANSEPRTLNPEPRTPNPETRNPNPEPRPLNPEPSRTLAAVVLSDGTRLTCRAAIVTTGTFLRGLMHTGEKQTEGGRVGEASSRGLSGCLARLGLELGRLKTGTPPRLHRASIDFAPFEPQPGDDEPMPFSFLNEYAPSGAADCRLPIADCRMKSPIRNPQSAIRNPAWRPPLPQVPCWIGGTNPQIHEIIRANLHRAPMYSGQIQSTGPRYCPSIEDKVVRFADKQRHQIFLEPEGLDTDEIYCNGISTSLPADVQDRIIRLVPGLENAQVLRWGYAVEYDMVWPTQIRSTLETKCIRGLFLAGQINGTSGYEEAAAQGLMAGINAAQYAAGREPDFVLGREQAYVGVLIDDLVTKPPIEPYRMFTSRAEHRLQLRSDNADERLTPIGRTIGLVDDSRWQRFGARRAEIDDALALLRGQRADDIAALDYLRRSEVSWSDLVARAPAAAAISPHVGRLIEVRAKYEGYIHRQDRQIERSAHWETTMIPHAIDFACVTGLRNEARQKLAQFTPRSLGQALRISGITHADVTVLAIHLDRATHRPATSVHYTNPC